MSRRCLALLLLTAFAPPATRTAAPPSPPVRVEVRFTVKELDPRGKKEGHLECVVINECDRPIKVPVGYSLGFDSDIVVFGRVGTDKKTVEHYSVFWDLRLVKRPAAGDGVKATTAVVPPGKEVVMFRESLDELLLARKGSYWSWEA